MIRLCIEKYMAVFCFTVLIAVVGVIAYITLPRESSPEVRQPYIFITTTYAGVPANDIETLVTQRIEQELEGLNGLKELSSQSRQNVSFIFAEFTSDVSVEEALRRTKDRVDLAIPELPDDADHPNVREFSFSDWPVFVAVLSHPDGVEAIDQASRLLQEDLQRIPGVLDVERAGHPLREVAVELDPFRMESYGFSIDDVTGAIQREHVTIPAGSLESQEKNYALSVTGEISDPAHFGQIILSQGDRRVPLSTVAHVAFQNTPDQTLSRFNSTPAITLSVKKRLGANIINLADTLSARIEEAAADLPAGTEVAISYDMSVYIRDMLMDLENNMATGFVLVLLVTVLFLGKRNALFVALAIPLAMLLSFFVLQIMGVTLNSIVLFSLILALGMLVDNGIVVVENIFRHQAQGKTPAQAAIDGAGEVAGPIAASTVTTLLAFFPIIFMPGVMGDFMRFLPMTVIVVLSASLFVALAINPVFCARFLSLNEKQRRRMEEGGGGFLRFQNWYTWILQRATRHAAKTVALITVLVLAGFAAYGTFGAEVLFFPDLDPERGRIRVEAPQGTPLARTDETVRQIEALIPETAMSIQSYSALSGRSGGDTESHLGTVDLTFSPYAQREIPGRTALDELRRKVQAITGAVVTVTEDDSGPPTGDDISYEIRGDDYQVMGEIASRVMEVLQARDHLFRNLDNDHEANQPEYRITIDRARAAHFGISTAEIAGTIRSAVTGTRAGTFRFDDEEYDINVRYRDDARDSLRTLRGVQIVARDGRRVPLSAVASVEPHSTVSVIKRRNMNRAVSVWANFNREVENRGAVIAEVEGEIQAIQEDLPPGYSIGAGAGFDIRDESTTFLMQAFLVAVFLIFIVLVAQFNSVMDPFIILFAVFLSLGGVFWGFALSGKNFIVIMSGIGSIALAGVAVNNCIVLVDYTHRLISQGMAWRLAVVEAGRTRLRPVLLTALTTVLALVPMALGISFSVHEFRVIVGSESSEYWTAFAWTMLYGLSFATITTLVVVPALLTIKYRALERLRQRKEPREAAHNAESA
ncbi:Multidrug efflux pump subunit AcrB [Alkalispirochaeta americana]|uniref:Multidrug efflux pump subunit AcrB n=1 Tax=Alkalispirochaeta americana TaxID=159291 RepID=A0A1N6N633_9SPIO|nr:efflux RND transporter permease subunit [Alkalispirochaeta americana]SIP87544.1 Multidrug efflux pump subunit AcrB [Alkalispirochaeta americana]